MPLNDLLDCANLEPFSALHAHNNTSGHGNYPDPLWQNAWNGDIDAFHFECINEFAVDALLELLYHLNQIELANIFVDKELSKSLSHSYVLLELSLRGLVLLRLLIINRFDLVIGLLSCLDLSHDSLGNSMLRQGLDIRLAILIVADHSEIALATFVANRCTFNGYHWCPVLLILMLWTACNDIFLTLVQSIITRCHRHHQALALTVKLTHSLIHLLVFFSSTFLYLRDNAIDGFEIVQFGTQFKVRLSHLGNRVDIEKFRPLTQGLWLILVFVWVHAKICVKVRWQFSDLVAFFQEISVRHDVKLSSEKCQAPLRNLIWQTFHKRPNIISFPTHNKQLGWWDYTYFDWLAKLSSCIYLMASAGISTIRLSLPLIISHLCT